MQKIKYEKNIHAYDFFFAVLILYQISSTKAKKTKVKRKIKAGKNYKMIKDDERLLFRPRKKLIF
jgi:hypothetical protein